MKRTISKTVIIVLCLSLGGCGAIGKIFGKKDEVKPLKPNPLPVIKESVAFKRWWTYDIGGDKQAGLRPAVDGDMVFIANPDGRVAALDLKSGRLQWRKDLDMRISGGVGTGMGLVMVGSLNGRVVALNRKDGSEVWRAPVSSEVMAPPEAAGGIVVVRTVDGAVTGLSATKGEERWKVTHEVPSLTLRGSGPPLIYQGVAVVGYADGKLGAIQMSDGAVLWQVPVSRPSGTNEVERMIDVDAKPLLRDDQLFTVAYHGDLTAYSLRINQVMWSKKMSSHTDISADADNVYVSDSNGRVHALDRATGAEVWVQDKLLRRRLSGPTVDGEYVLVGDYEGYLHVMDKEDGKLVGRDHFGDQISLEPLIAGGRILVMTEGGRLSSVSVTPAGS
ncbi:MAG: outer membrane protein assembly factor BamB [Arenicellales bacterium]